MTIHTVCRTLFSSSSQSSAVSAARHSVLHPSSSSSIVIASSPCAFTQSLHIPCASFSSTKSSSNSPLSISSSSFSSSHSCCSCRTSSHYSSLFSDCDSYLVPRRGYQYVSSYWNSVLPPQQKTRKYPPVTPLKVFERDEYAMRKSKYANNRYRTLRGQFPAQIVMRDGKVDKDCFIAVPLREFEKETRKAFVFNRVFELQVHKAPPTLAPINIGYGPHAPPTVPITDPVPPPPPPFVKYLAVPTGMQRHPLTRSIINMTFCHFIPGRPNRIKMPVNYIGELSGPAAKKGANVSTFATAIEMVWEGGVEIPESIDVDLSEAKLGHTVRLKDLKLPPGLTPFSKNRDYVLATVRSTTEEVLSEEEEQALEEAEKAAAVTATPAGGEKKEEGGGEESKKK